MKIMTILSMFLLLSGCASAPPSWKKQGVSIYDRDNALASCEYEVGLNKVAVSEQDKLIENCMKAKGFRMQY